MSSPQDETKKYFGVPDDYEDNGINIHKNNSPEIAELVIVFIILY